MTAPAPAPPGGVTGLVNWLRADDVAGADAALVDSWPARVGAAGVAAGTARPSKRIAVVNGHPVVRFDGLDDSVSVSPDNSVYVGVPFTQIVVLRVAVAGSTGVPLRRGLTPFSGPGAFFRENYVVVHGFSTTAEGGPPVGWLPVGGARVVTLSAAGLAAGDAVLFRDGAPVSFGAEAAAALGQTGDVRGPVHLGRFDTADFWAGDVAEVLLYDRALSAAERVEVHRYLQTRYAVAMADVPVPVPQFAGTVAARAAVLAVSTRTAGSTGTAPARAVATTAGTAGRHAQAVVASRAVTTAAATVVAVVRTAVATATTTAAAAAGGTATRHLAATVTALARAGAASTTSAGNVGWSGRTSARATAAALGTAVRRFVGTA